VFLSDKLAPASFISPITLETPEYGIRIVCLPKGYETKESVYELVETIFGLGQPSCIRIQEFICSSPVQPTYYSAFVYFVNFYKTNIAESITQSIQGLPLNTTLKVFPSFTEFYWNNGKKMLHLSFQRIKPMETQTIMMSEPMMMTTETNPPVILPLEESDWSGLHIPIITNDMCIDGKRFLPTDFEDFIENKLQIGKVRRIDYVERDDIVKTADGRIEHINKGDIIPGSIPVTAIFIHMKYWYDTLGAHTIRNNLVENGQFRLSGYWNKETNTTHYFKNIFDEYKKPYFVLKINHRPIPDADGKLNIHQLAAIKTKLEKEIEELKATSQKAVQDLYSLLEEVVEENKDLRSKLQVEIQETN
jgi:hypothetical protein